MWLIMSKKFGCRTPCNSQLVKPSENQHHSTSILLFYQLGKNWVGKCLSFKYLKSWECLLIYWLPMTSILFVKGRIYLNQFNCNYLRNKECFLNFLLHISNLHQNLNTLKNKKILIGYVFSKLETSKYVVI